MVIKENIRVAMHQFLQSERRDKEEERKKNIIREGPRILDRKAFHTFFPHMMCSPTKSTNRTFLSLLSPLYELSVTHHSHSHSLSVSRTQPNKILGWHKRVSTLRTQTTSNVDRFFS